MRGRCFDNRDHRSRADHGHDLATAIAAEAIRLGSSLDAGQRRCLRQFGDLALSWAGHTNLLSANRPDEQASEGHWPAIEPLFSDALAIDSLGWMQHFDALTDVGAGVGAPPIPLALLYPHLQLTLIEPRRKRVSFLRSAIGALGLSSRATVIEGRLESLPPLEKCTTARVLASSRATFEPRRWLELATGVAPHALVFLGHRDSPILSEQHVSGATDRPGMRRLAASPDARSPEDSARTLPGTANNALRAAAPGTPPEAPMETPPKTLGHAIFRWRTNQPTIWHAHAQACGWRLEQGASYRVGNRRRSLLLLHRT